MKGFTEEEIRQEAESRGLIPPINNYSQEDLLAEAKKRGLVDYDISKPESAVRGAIQGASFGFGDEVSGSIAAAYAKLFGGDATADMPLGDLYQQGTDLERQKNKEAELANPKSYLAGDVAGSVITPGGAIKDAKTIGELARVGAGAGIIQGAGRSESDTPLGVLADAGIGGITGAVVTPAASKVVNTATNVVKKAYSGINNLISGNAPSSINIDVTLPKGTVTDDIRQAMKGVSGDVVKEFQSDIKNGLTPNQALIKQQAKQMNVRLSTGDITQDVSKQAEEDLALKGVYGQHAQNMVKGFRDAQQGDLRNLGMNVATTLGKKDTAFGNEADLGVDIANRIKKSAAEDKKVASDAYDIAGKMKAYAPIESITDFPKVLRKSLTKEGFDVDFMPSVSKRLSEANNFIQKAQKVGVSGVGLNTLEQFRKRIVNSASGSDAERTALGIMKKTYDSYADDIIDQGLLKGDDAALNQIKDARGLWSAYKQKYFGSDNESIIGKIVKKDYTPEQTMQLLIGSGKLGTPRQSAKTVGQLRDILGEDSPEFTGLKQAGFARLFGDNLQSLLDGDLTKAISGGKFAKNVDTFLGTNQSLAKTLYTTDELNLIKSAARVSAQATTRQPGAVNPSGTAPALLRVFNQLLEKIPIVGKYASGAASKSARSVVNLKKETEIASSLKGEIPQISTPEINSFSKILGEKAGLLSSGETSN